MKLCKKKSQEFRKTNLGTVSFQQSYKLTARYLVPFVQFKKHEKRPWRSVTFSKVAEVTLLHGRFSLFLNCTYGTKSQKAPYVYSTFSKNGDM